jgi:glycosyltransferase involved in cell wall biosynthesis
MAELVSIVVPSYGGRECLPVLIEKLDAIMKERDQSFEIIVVNDSSPDETWPVLQKLAGEYPALIAIDLLHNHGQFRATICGLAHARGDVVVTMDDDLQHPPEELPKLIDALERNPEWDAAVGSWPRDQGWFRNLGSRVYAFLDRLAWKTPRGFRQSGFRAIRRPVVDAMLAHQTRVPIPGPLLLQCSDRVSNVEVEHHQRAFGQSGFRLRSSIATVLANFLGGSTMPLRLLSRFGVLCAVVAVGLATYLLSRQFLGIATLPGWTSSLLAIAFFGGATLFGIGILGEYLHLMMVEVRKPPRWNVRSTLGREREVS